MSAMLEHRIKALLDREDIESLLEVGAPDDEYEIEARMIYKGITELQRNKSLDIASAVKLIKDVWQEMFGPMNGDQLEAREPAFRRIALEVCSAA